MSLFVGNISKYVKTFELEDEFKQFGHCEIKRNVSNVSALHYYYYYTEKSERLPLKFKDRDRINEEEN